MKQISRRHFLGQSALTMGATPILSNVVAQAPAPATGTAPAPPVVTGEPKVTLERDGDRIKCIKIQCGCGHIIELACAYEAAAPAGEIEPEPLSRRARAVEAPPAPAKEVEAEPFQGERRR